MPDIKLTYFDFNGGRGEVARIALSIGGIDFEDHRVSFPEFGQQRDGYRFRCLPVADIDGNVIAQSNAMNRYIGRLVGLYPEDPVQAMFCDEAMGAVEDILHHTVQTFGLESDELRIARENLVAGWLTTYIKGIAELVERGGDYIAGGELSVADLKVYLWVRSLRSGTLDHVPTDLVDRLAPALAAHQERIAREPGVVAYYQKIEETTGGG